MPFFCYFGLYVLNLGQLQKHDDDDYDVDDDVLWIAQRLRNDQSD